TDLIGTGLFGDVKVNYLNSDIKLQDELAIYKADRAAFFIKEGPFITFSFGAKLGQVIQQANSENRQTVHRLFSTITQKLLPPNTKYMPVRTEQQEYGAMCLFKDIYDKSLAVEVAVSGILNKYDCEFQGTNIVDNYKIPTPNEEPNALPTDPKEPDSHIDEVLMINGPFQSIQQNILFLLQVSVPTNAITLSPAFGLANSGQLLNKYPLGNNPVVSYDAVNVTRSPYTINYGSDPLDAKKLDLSSYELKSNSQVAFETGVYTPIGIRYAGGTGS
ncbi:MAG: hypothetical protein EZS28_042577, partial [Streblomastix strix]